MVVVHGGLARTAVFYSLILGLWALWRYIRRQGMDSSFLGAGVIAEILYLAQGLVGIILIISGHLPGLARPAVHILYGVATLLVIPGIFVYTRGDNSRRAMLIYAIGFLFLFLMLWTRAISTGEESQAPASLLPLLGF
jgi:hypothetical protein